MLFPLDGWRQGPVPVLCECAAETCAHRGQAIDAALDMLYEPGGAMAARLAKALAVPAWSKMLRALDEEALEKKTFAAPPSDRILIRTALSKLRELVRSEGGEG